MAINIYSGSNPKGVKRNSASNSSRASALKDAFTGSTTVSSSGNTAVKDTGLLGKVGNLVQKALPIVSKVLPGPIGAVAKVASSVFNDPEWWQSIPGEGVTLNAPLGNYTFQYQSILNDAESTPVSGNCLYRRPVFLEITRAPRTLAVEDDFEFGVPLNMPTLVICPNDTMITQYLMPEIRKVVNAVPLQTAEAYKEVIAANATLYAMWRNLKRYDYMLKHGQTYIPNTNVNAFPILQVVNNAQLVAMINRIEEALRASIRLPHTMCEYLAWRFGRIYKMNSSKKSGLVLYNVIPMTSAIDEYQRTIERLMQVQSYNTGNQQANADLYNAYFDHDMMVEIKDETQFMYDMKEFALRTNLDAGTKPDFVLNPVSIDSDLDNPTTFMASTVSTMTALRTAPLVPVAGVTAYTYSTGNVGYIYNTNTGATTNTWSKIGDWYYQDLTPNTLPTSAAVAEYLKICDKAATAKACEYYNAGLVLGCAGDSIVATDRIDITALSMDLGQVENRMIETEQVYAFANMVYPGHKTSLTYRAAEKLVAKDVANTLDTLDIASVAAPAHAVKTATVN